MIVDGKTSTEILAEIALEHLDIETLEQRKSDELDFHEVFVTSLEEALREALMAGVQIGSMLRADQEKLAQAEQDEQAFID